MHTQWHSSRFELRYVSVKFYYNNIFHPISINTAVVHRMAGKVYSYQLLSNPDKSCLHFALCSQSIPFSWSMHIAVVVDLIDKQSLLCTEVYHSQTSIFYVCELLSRYSKKILAQSTLSTPYIILSQVDLVGNFNQSIFVTSLPCSCMYLPLLYLCSISYLTTCMKYQTETHFIWDFGMSKSVHECFRKRRRLKSCQLLSGRVYRFIRPTCQLISICTGAGVKWACTWLIRYPILSV